MKLHVPDCLMPYADTPAWVAWNSERHNGEMRKVPKCPRAGANASVSDPSTWGILAAARRLAEVRAYPGVGIVSAAVPALVFLDLDRCIVRIIGTAAAIEATISRKGATRGGLALEIYKAAPRYLTVTGRRFGEHPDALTDIGDAVLDLLPLLGKATPTDGAGDGREDAELVRAIATGDGFHAELCALAARYVGRGISATVTAETLRGLMLAHPEAVRDDRWRDRFGSIAELVTSAAAKYAEGAAHRRALAKLAGQMIRNRRPSAEMRAAMRAEAETRGIDAEQAEGILEWAVRRELARRKAARG